MYKEIRLGKRYLHYSPTENDARKSLIMSASFDLIRKAIHISSRVILIRTKARSSCRIPNWTQKILPQTDTQEGSSSEKPKTLDFLDFDTISLYNDIVRKTRRIRL